MHNTTKLAVGTKIYYTGDMANQDGRFEVTGMHNGHISLRELNGPRFFTVRIAQIGDVYAGHCNPRFVTELARQTYRAQQLGRMAFARGVKAASALDEQFCEMLKGVSLSDGLVLLDAWAFGWHSANLGH